jgi:hypothetical protein
VSIRKVIILVVGVLQNFLAFLVLGFVVLSYFNFLNIQNFFDVGNAQLLALLIFAFVSFINGLLLLNEGLKR